jgi:hypothetical protein
MQASPCNGTLAQRWWKDARGALHPLHILRLCLDVAGESVSPGAPLQVGSVDNASVTKQQREKAACWHAQIKILQRKVWQQGGAGSNA